ncbi:MAG: putative DNA binding domain-containing protein, partial [Kiritimatiellae bacterium]|nr:putative DNA binding domain-containing protein [Kiritimatiellia bacterium]
MPYNAPQLMTDTENKTIIDVVQRENDYVLFHGGQPLCTPEGDEVAHRSPRLLEQLQREWPTNPTPSLPVTALGPDLFRTVCALLQAQDDTATTHWTTLLEADPLISKPAFDTASGKQNNPAFMAKLMEDQTHFAFFFNGLANAVKSCNRFLLDFTEGHIDFAQKNSETLSPLFYQAYQELAVEEKAAIHLLASIHACGILLPMLLILRRLSSAEYTGALFGLHPPQEPPQSTLLNPFPERLAAPELPATRPDWNQPETSFNTLRAQVWSVLDFVLSADSVKTGKTDVLQIIRAGEDFNTEFKTSLRWNVKAERKDPAMENAVLKTVNAFLNSSGGRLLIGVR